MQTQVISESSTQGYCAETETSQMMLAMQVANSTQPRPRIAKIQNRLGPHQMTGAMDSKQSWQPWQGKHGQYILPVRCVAMHSFWGQTDTSRAARSARQACQSYPVLSLWLAASTVQAQGAKGRHGNFVPVLLRQGLVPQLAQTIWTAEQSLTADTRKAAHLTSSTGRSVSLLPTRTGKGHQ